MQTASTSSTFEKHGGPWNKTLQVLVNSGLARRSKHGVGLAARCLTIAWVIWSPEGSQRPTLQRYHAVYWCFLSKDVLYRCIAQSKWNTRNIHYELTSEPVRPYQRHPQTHADSSLWPLVCQLVPWSSHCRKSLSCQLSNYVKLTIKIGVDDHFWSHPRSRPKSTMSKTLQKHSKSI